MVEAEEALEFEIPPMDELQALLPNYTFELFLAQGGMGAIYKARQKSIDRPVAIKFLPKELSADRIFAQQFIAEAKAMARLNHPNLVALHDFGEVGRMLYIVMEYVDGKSLYESTFEQIVEPEDAIRITKGVLLGLGHAHDADILHRDIKPGNIFLTSAKALPKIGDFGLASSSKDSAADADGVIFGTAGYTAPEVVNDPDNVDLRADIYSVGAMLHQLLTSSLPGELGLPPSTVVGCPKELDAIIEKAMSENRKDRYKSCEEMSEDLDRALEVVQGKRKSKIKAKKGKSSEDGSWDVKKLILVGAGVAALAILGGLSALVGGKKSEEENLSGPIEEALTSEKKTSVTGEPSDPQPSSDPTALANGSEEKPSEAESNEPSVMVSDFDVESWSKTHLQAVKSDEAQAQISEFTERMERMMDRFERAEIRKMKRSGSSDLEKKVEELAQNIKTLKSLAYLPVKKDEAGVTDSFFNRYRTLKGMYDEQLTGLGNTLAESHQAFLKQAEDKMKELQASKDQAGVRALRAYLQGFKGKPEGFARVLLAL